MPTEREVIKSNDSNSSDISSISTTAVAVASSLDSAENEFESSGNSMKVLLSLAVGLSDGNNGFFMVNILMTVDFLKRIKRNGNQQM
jgi:hypothetical protein